MTTRPPPTPAERLRRKQDLLLASRLARQQAMVAIDQIGQRADVLVGSCRQVRAWMAVPQVGAATGALGSIAALLALRRVLRPMVKLMLARGITFPYLSELLKSLFVEVADREFRVDITEPTDSRVSLISGVHA